MGKFKSKSFFIKSVFLHIFLTLIVVFFSLRYFEPLAYNTMHYAFTADKTGTDKIAVIVIDDKSIEHYRWPWSRDLYAKIFEYLHDYSKAELIGFDAIIVSEDKNNPNGDIQLNNTIKRMNNLTVGFSALRQEYADESTGKSYENKFNNKFKLNIIDKRSKKFKKESKYNSISHFPDGYFDAVKSTGTVNVNMNANGFVVYSDQIISINGTNYPSLSMRMYMQYKGIDSLTITDKNIKVGDIIIPTICTKNNVQSYTHFYGTYENSEYTHKKYSAIDVIKSLDNLKQGKKPIIDPTEFNNKIVFVGANAKASALGLEDALPTPILHKHPGVDIQATNLDNLINNEFVKKTTLKQDLSIILVLTLITSILILKTSFFKSLIALILMASAYIIFVGISYSKGFAPNIITPLAVQLVTMIFGYSYRFIVEGKNKEKIQQAMGKYLSQDIMKNVVKNIDDIKLGGKKAEVTVLFADIRGFTSMSEKMSAEEVSYILNEYFTAIEPVITKYNGVINKFIGDAVMAIFGEPIHDVEHAKNAVLCANEMLRTVEILRDKWLFEGKPKIEIGIGINTGEAFVGNIGSEKRLEYTVIGDMVNLASRIESYNKVYKTNLLISSSTYKHVSKIADVIKISEVSIRGKSKKMDIYEVLRLT